MSIKQSKTNKKSGFTIIEVVLVLAIAGLIFLMVFVALPALQRNQRDTQRRDDYAMLQSAIISLYSNDGRVPTSVTGVVVGRDGDDPQGNEYDLQIYNPSQNTVSAATATGAMSDVEAGGTAVYYMPKATCNSNGAPTRASSTSTTSFVIYGSLEGGTYCRTGQFQ